MVKIITDTSTLFNVDEGNKLGIHVIPLCISINNLQLRDLQFDINIFKKELQKGIVPTSSQPPIGEVVNAYESYEGEEILNICMADGLSGTYQSALSARELAKNTKDIHVLNSTTLCGPHRYLVQKAIKLKNEGKNVKEIIEGLQDSMKHSDSFLIPQDFEFLKRGGRLKPAAATIGGLLRIKPIMKLVDGGKRLDKFSIARSEDGVINTILKYFEEKGVDENYLIHISHADVLEFAEKFKNRMKERFRKTEIELFDLSAAFITQGGPKCIAVQYIKK